MEKDIPLPYITFPITSVCQLRCAYCNKDGSGEAFDSGVKFVSPNEIERIASIAHDTGIRKIRITGGEPLLHPHIERILLNLSKLSDVKISLNTNGLFIDRLKNLLSSPPNNIKYIVSLDTLDRNKFKIIAGRSTGKWGDIRRVFESISVLQEKKVLQRINMVLTKDNFDEVLSMVDFCRANNCDLKISDIAEPSDMRSSLETSYVAIDKWEAKLDEMCDFKIKHEYSKFYGIPQTVYSIDGVRVTVKNSSHGATHSIDGPCQSCSHYPCEEGLYFIYANCNGTFSACRKKGYLMTENGKNTKVILHEMQNQLKETHRSNIAVIKRSLPIKLSDILIQ
jgi:molybdenum cofactor biosynthesis enzyme MoaA